MEENTNQKFIERIREARHANRITARELADAVGIKVSDVYDIERGRKNPSDKVLQKMDEYI